MTIPSPRTFIEILAFIFFALFVCAGTAVACFFLLLIWGAEKIYDGVQGWKMRRRAR